MFTFLHARGIRSTVINRNYAVLIGDRSVIWGRNLDFLNRILPAEAKRKPQTHHLDIELSFNAANAVALDSAMQAVHHHRPYESALHRDDHSLCCNV